MRAQLKFKRHFAFFDLQSAEVNTALISAAICQVVQVADRQEDSDGGEKMRSEWLLARERVLDTLIQSSVRNMAENQRPALASQADALFEQVFMHSVHLSYE